MAGRALYVKLNIHSNAKSLAGYTVLGDSVTNGERTLFLERPAIAAATPNKKKNPAATTATKAATKAVAAATPAQPSPPRPNRQLEFNAPPDVDAGEGDAA